MTAQVSRPQFTTSQKAAEERAEDRSDYFADNITVTEGSRKPSGVKTIKQPVMKPAKDKPLPIALSHRQKNQLKK